MGIALWGFLLLTLFWGLKTAVIIYGAAIIIGFSWGTYKFWKQRIELSKEEDDYDEE